MLHGSKFVAAPEAIPGMVRPAHPPSVGLHQLVLACGAVLVLMVLSLIGGALWHHRQETVQNGLSTAQNLAMVIAGQVEAVVNTIDQSLQRTTLVLEFAAPTSDYREVADPLLLAINKEVPYLRTLSHYDARGTLIRTSQPEATVRSIADQDWFLHHRDHPAQGLQITVYNRGDHSDDPTFVVLSRRVVDAEGRFAGVVVAVPDRRFLQRQFDTVVVGDGGVVALSLMNGLVLVRAPDEPALVGISLAKLPLYQEMIDNPAVSGSQRGVYVSDGRVRLVGWYKLPVGELVVRVALAEDDLLGDWYEDIALYGLGGTLFLILVMALLGLLIIQLRRREQAEWALRESERFATSTIDALKTLICVLNEQGAIVATNLAWRQAALPVGVKNLDLGFNYLRLCEAASSGEYASDRQLGEGIRAVMRGERELHTQECLRDTGQGRLRFFTRVTRFTGTGPVRVVVSHHDVTDRHRALEAMIRLKERAETYLAIAEAIILELDPQGVVRRINRQGCLVLGYDEEELIGRNWIETCLPEETRTQTQAEYARIMAGEAPLVEYREYQVVTRDRRLRYISWHNQLLPEKDGQTAGMICSGQDTTERRLIEDRLRASERRLAMAQTIAHLGNWEEDLDSRLIWWSDEVYRIFERSGDGFGATFTDYLSYVHPDDAEMVNIARKRLLKERAAIWLDHRILLPDGRIRYVHLQAELITDPQGMPVCSAGTIQDITERKRAENELRLAMQEAALANRTKSEFLANISHELNTPLNAVIGFSELLTDESIGVLGAEKYREFAGSILRSGLHLQEIISDILDIAKIDLGDVPLDEEVIDLAGLIEERVQRITPDAEDAGLTIHTMISSEQLGLVADRRLVKQVLRSLLSNAVKFTPHGGRIDVRCERDDNGMLALAVADTGIGIADEDIPRVFERFSQIDSTLSRSYDGTGIGLSLTKAIIERHGGSIDIVSQLRHGTVVTARFPANRILLMDAEAPSLCSGRVA